MSGGAGTAAGLLAVFATALGVWLLAFLWLAAAMLAAWRAKRRARRARRRRLQAAALSDIPVWRSTPPHRAGGG